jgi:hypothetical protein
MVEPPPYLFVGLGNTSLLSAYRWQVSACNAGACSPWSNYGRWAEVFPWPW